MKIAITGGIGCGKTTVSDFFAQHGFPVFSADKICHQLMTTPQIKSTLLEHFGSTVFIGNEVDRAALAQIVFDNPQELAFLTRIIHAEFSYELDNIFANNNIVFVEVPLLYEKSMADKFDFVIAVWSSPEVCKSRLTHWADGQYEKRSALQISADEKLEMADFAIINNDGLESLNLQLEILYEQLEGISTLDLI